MGDQFRCRAIDTGRWAWHGVGEEWLHDNEKSRDIRGGFGDRLGWGGHVVVMQNHLGMMRRGQCRATTSGNITCIVVMSGWDDWGRQALRLRMRGTVG